MPLTSSTSSTIAPIGPVAIVSSTPSKRRDRVNAVNGLLALRGALLSSYAAGAAIELPSGTFTIPELTDEIDAYRAAVAEVAAATHAFHAAVDKERKLREAQFARRAELKAVVAARLGKHAIALASYGFAPEKVRVVSPKAKLVGAIKAKATRLARGTMGPKQRLAITGNVTGVVVAPVVGPPRAEGAVADAVGAPGGEAAVTRGG
jgi:hypothetical protein